MYTTPSDTTPTYGTYANGAPITIAPGGTYDNGTPVPESVTHPVPNQNLYPLGAPYGFGGDGKPLPAPTSYSRSNTDPNSTDTTTYPRSGNAADDTLSKLPDAPQTEDQIREANLSRAQELIASINKEFDTKVSDRRTTGDVNKKSSDAVDVAAGLIGSDFNVANRAVVDKATQTDVDSINADRADKIASVLDSINQRSHTQAVDAQNTYDTELKNSSDANARNLTASKADANALALQGVTLDKLKSQPDLYNSLLKQTGQDPMIFDATYNEALNAANKVTYTYHSLSNGKTLRTGVKADGTNVPEQVFDYGMKPTDKIQMIGGKPYVATYDDSGKLTSVKLAPGYTPAPGTNKVTQQQASAAMAADLKSVAGADGYIDPKDYAANLAKWVQAGYPASTFHSKFSNFRNPNDSGYNTGTKKATSTPAPILRSKTSGLVDTPQTFA